MRHIARPPAPDPPPFGLGGRVERLLVVADAAVANVTELPPEVSAEIDAAIEVYVVTPTLPGRLAWLASELNSSRHAADERLDTVLGHMRSMGIRARGRAGDDSVLTAVADAVTEFQPDHIVIGLRSPAHANWQERHLTQRVRTRFGLPVTTYSIDPAGHVSTVDLPA